MTCADLDFLLCDYLDGTLDEHRRAIVERHLAACPACSALVADSSQALSFMARVEPVEPPNELLTRLLFHVSTSSEVAKPVGLRAFLRRWMEPVLQPRFAMGMAMTILSFSLVGKFSAIPDRPLKPEDLRPAKLWAAVDDRMHRTWNGLVKYYENLKVVYEIQNRLSEWGEEPETPADTTTPGGAPSSTEQQEVVK